MLFGYCGDGGGWFGVLSEPGLDWRMLGWVVVGGRGDGGEWGMGGEGGSAVMVGVSDACTTTVIPAKAGIQRGGATGRRSFFELGCEGLERMGRMGDGRDGTAVMVGVSDACTTTVIPAKAGIQRGGATGRRSFFELGCERLERMGRMGDGRDGTAVKER